MSAYSSHHPIHQWPRPREEFRDRTLGDPEAGEELVVEGCRFGGWTCCAVDGGEDVVYVHCVCAVVYVVVVVLNWRALKEVATELGVMTEIRMERR